MATKAELELVTSTGVSFNALTDKWTQTGDMSVNYMAVAAPLKAT
jgi:2-polyprenyl-3-methyl-5-hydroxy-6-metoxy-1,4-benzoquinol methylase